jgi:hypothetical protein
MFEGALSNANSDPRVAKYERKTKRQTVPSGSTF